MMTLEEVAETRLAAFGEEQTCAAVGAKEADAQKRPASFSGKYSGLQLKTKAATSGRHQPPSPASTASPMWTIGECLLRLPLRPMLVPADWVHAAVKIFQLEYGI